MNGVHFDPESGEPYCGMCGGLGFYRVRDTDRIVTCTCDALRAYLAPSDEVQP